MAKVDLDESWRNTKKVEEEKDDDGTVKYNADKISVSSVPSYTASTLSTSSAPTYTKKQLNVEDAPKYNKTQLNAEDAPVYNAYTANQFAPSQAYTDAMAYTNAMLEKLNGGTTSYTDKINSIMDEIENRESFSYDPNTDTLFQNSLAGAVNKGQLAMQDTMGQAAALTGGYGSTYATAAANQAYNAYIQDAYANLPDYYNMALQAYQLEGDQLNNKLAMYESADSREYDRNVNAYNLNYTQAQNLYNQEYNNYWQTENFNQGERQYAYESLANNYWNTQNYNQAENQFAYNADANNYWNTQNYNQAENQFAANMANSNYWNTQNYNQSESHYASSLANSNYWNAMNYNQSEKQYAANFAYNQAKDALAQSNYEKEFEYQKEQDAAKAAAANEVTYKEPSETQKKKALEIYNTEGEAGLLQYVDSLPSDINVDLIAEYIDAYGVDKKNYSVSKDTFNWFGGLDKDDKVKDQYEKEYTIDELYNALLAQGKTRAEAKEYINNIYKK